MDRRSFLKSIPIIGAISTTVNIRENSEGLIHLPNPKHKYPCMTSRVKYHDEYVCIWLHDNENPTMVNDGWELFTRNGEYYIRKK